MRTRLIDEIIVWDIANWSQFLPFCEFCEQFLDSDSASQKEIETGVKTFARS